MELLHINHIFKKINQGKTAKWDRIFLNKVSYGVYVLSENANCGTKTRMTGTKTRNGTEIFWKTNYINRRRMKFWIELLKTLDVVQYKYFKIFWFKSKKSVVFASAECSRLGIKTYQRQKKIHTVNLKTNSPSLKRIG